MEDEDPIAVLKPQLFLPRKLRRRMNYFWAFKKPKDPDIEMKVRKMKRIIIDRASVYAADEYAQWKRFVEDRDKVLPEFKQLEGISKQIEAGVFTPAKLTNAIYSRMLEEVAYEQFLAVDEETAAQQFIEETVLAAERVKQLARAAVAAAEQSKKTATAAEAAEEVTAAARFAIEAAEAAQVAEVAAESALEAKRTKETFENAKLARKATANAKFAMKTAQAVKLVEDETTQEATPYETVLERKLGKLMISEDSS